MPELKNLKPSLLGCYLTGSLIGLYSSKDKKLDLSLRLATRLLDKAVKEYLMVRDLVLLAATENAMTFEEIEKRGEGQYLHEIGITNHIENCINALGRIYLLMPGSDSSSSSPKIREMRNMVEHMDEKINRGVTGPIGLDISEDATHIEIFFRNKKNTHEEVLSLSTGKLADELKRLHSFISQQR